METKTITINGLEIHYSDNENTSKRSLLFIHGNSLSGGLFHAQFNDAELNQYRLVAPDLPGHGASAKSENPEKDYGVLSFIDMLQQLVKELSLKHIVLVGHSLGGHIAIHLMKALQNNGVIIDGIALMGTPPLTMPPRMDQAFFANPAMGLAFKGELSDDEITMLASAFTHQKDALDSVKQQIQQSDPMVRPMIGQSIATQLTEDEVEILKSTKAPIAVLHGRKDELVNDSYIKNQRIEIWENKIHYIPDAGHCAFLENPGELNAKLVEFVNVGE
ncbi:MAG: alpha/beta hydrolase [Salinivirgaceae bacterium]